jgi:hypothetical protein
MDGPINDAREKVMDLQLKKPANCYRRSPGEERSLHPDVKVMTLTTYDGVSDLATETWD